LISSTAHADYPIAGHRYLADPGAVAYKGRIYVYASNDDDNKAGYDMKSNVCVSTADLKNWTDHGIVFQVPRDASWAGMTWAPQPIQRDGTIYLYFGNSTGGIGVATSKDPTGGFKDPKGGYVASGNTAGVNKGGWYFDPGAFIDDDGTGYLAFGGNGDKFSNIVKLGSDLISVSGSAVQLPVQSFLEASFLFKRKDSYYYVYSTTGSTGQKMDYLMSKSPMSGWAYVGTLADNPPQNGNNNQTSELEFNGQWYHVFHNRSVAKAAGIDATLKRNLGVEVLSFNDTGTMKKIVYTTDGVPQVGTLNPYERVEAETTNAQSGIETETCSEGGMDVTSIASGDWIRVRGVNFGSSGAKTFTARVAATAAGGAIELHLDTLSGTLIGTCTVPSTGGAQTWQTTTCPVTGATGIKDLYLKFTGTFNFNYWQFDGGTADSDGGVSVKDSGAGSGGRGGVQPDAGASGGSSGGGTGGVRSTSSSSAVGGSSTATSRAMGGAVSSSSSSTSSPASAGAGGSTIAGSAGSTGNPTATTAATVDAGTPNSNDSGGCSCEVGGGRTRPWPLFILALLALRLSRRGRRSLQSNRCIKSE
jgi:arabinoxylan arabinofuranohydrolase